MNKCSRSLTAIVGFFAHPIRPDSNGFCHKLEAVFFEALGERNHAAAVAALRLQAALADIMPRAATHRAAAGGKAKESQGASGAEPRKAKESQGGIRRKAKESQQKPS